MAERTTSSARRTSRALAGEASLAEQDRLRRIIEDYEKEVAGLRGQLREIVRQSDERLAFFGRATHEAVWDWDFTTDTVWWNDGLRTQFGHPINADTARVEWWRQTIHPDDQARIWRTLDDRLRQELWSDEYRFRRGDGTFAHVYARGYVVRGAGRPPAPDDRRDARHHGAQGVRAGPARQRGAPPHGARRRPDRHLGPGT